MLLLYIQGNITIAVTHRSTGFRFRVMLCTFFLNRVYNMINAGRNKERKKKKKTRKKKTMCMFTTCSYGAM